MEFVWEWVAYLLSNWNFLEVLEYLGRFSILIAVIFYFYESGDRIKQKHYQAWQVVNTAQGKGGNGGRIEALQELNLDGVPLVGVNASGAFLQGIHMQYARLLRSDFSKADVRNSDFQSADFADATLSSANFRNGILSKASFSGAQLDDVDFFGADLSGADFSGANLGNADLRNANLAGIRWRNIRNLHLANVYGVRNAPEGFLPWALQQGAVSIESDDKWLILVQSSH
jgi:uncharacterized protein YjbI with pentapeptide repeats